MVRIKKLPTEAIGPSIELSGLPNLYRDPQPDPALAESIRRKYQDLGGATGILGSSVAEIQGTPDRGAFQNFQRGIILAHTRWGTHYINGIIWNKWVNLGGINGLGYPVTDVTSSAPWVLYSPFWSEFQRGFISSHSSLPVDGSVITTRVVHGAIFDKWKSMGGINGVLGFPITDELSVGGGVYNNFRNGSIYSHPNIGTYEIHGPIWEKWSRMPSNLNFGFPITDTLSAADGGLHNDFQHGSIYWHSSVGAHEVHGAIRDKWFGLSSDLKNLFGYPITDELKTPDQIGRFNHFQGGSIYWHPDVDAHEVYGLIRNKWEDMGWERGALGYPRSDPLGNRQEFQHGHILIESGRPISYCQNPGSGCDRVITPTPPSPREARVPVYLDRQPIYSGYVPYVADFGLGINGNLTKIENPAGSGVILSFVKQGYTTDYCGDTNAVVLLYPGQSITDLTQLFGTSNPGLPVRFVACVFATGALSRVLIMVTYTYIPR